MTIVNDLPETDLSTLRTRFELEREVRNICLHCTLVRCCLDDYADGIETDNDTCPRFSARLKAIEARAAELGIAFDSTADGEDETFFDPDTRPADFGEDGESTCR